MKQYLDIYDEPINFYDIETNTKVILLNIHYMKYPKTYYMCHCVKNFYNYLSRIRDYNDYRANKKCLACSGRGKYPIGLLELK